MKMFYSLRWAWLAVVVSPLLSMPRAVEGNIVYIFRHCHRAIDIKDLNEYSDTPFPAWSVPEGECLPRGIRLMEGIGKTLRKLHGESFKPVIIADEVQRDKDSAAGLAKGLGLGTTVTTNKRPFDDCDQFKPSKDDRSKLIQQALPTTPVPDGYDAMIATVDGILRGNKKIADETNEVTRGDWKGKAQRAGLAGQVLLMQLGAGMEVGWGRVSPADVYKLDALHAYEWSVRKRNLPLAQYQSSKMLVSILDALSATSHNKDTLFLGHDSDISGVGVLLNAHAHAPPYGDNTLAPGVAWRLENDGNTVKLDLVYPMLESEDPVEVKSTRVFEMSIAEFCQLVVSRINWSCGERGGGLCSMSTEDMKAAAAAHG